MCTQAHKENNVCQYLLICRCFNGADARVMSFSVGLTKAFATTEVTMDYEFTTFYYDANPTNYKAIWFEIVVCLGECTVSRPICNVSETVSKLLYMYNILELC